MASRGEQLRAARERLGLSVADAASRLHLRTMFVEAMENEQWTLLGETVYARGFVRNYARLLGLDPEPFLAALPAPRPLGSEGRVQTEPLASDEVLVSRLQHAPQRPRWHPWVIGILTVIAAVMVVNVTLGLWSLGAFRWPGSAMAPRPVVSPTSGAQASSVNLGNTLQASAAVPTRSGGVNLRLQLTQPSWLSVTVDGKRVVYETLPAGTVREFHGQREIVLRAGNAGGVIANFDGKDLGTLGQAGEVQDRVFAVQTPPPGVTGTHE
jgi:cytoskeleton protein RodZ